MWDVDVDVESGEISGLWTWGLGRRASFASGSRNLVVWHRPFLPPFKPFC